MQIDASEFRVIQEYALRIAGVFISDEEMDKTTKRIETFCDHESIDDLPTLLGELKALESNSRTNRLLDYVISVDEIFFGDYLTFDSLQKHVAPAVAEMAADEKKLRLWSAATQNGHEVYSISILLEDALTMFEGWDIQLRATDVSKYHLSRAAEGLYEGTCIERDFPKKLRAKHFVSRGAWYAIADRHRNRVQFSLHSLLSEKTLGRQHIILFRYLLRYFSEADQEKLLEKLYHSLVPGGFLLLGPGEYPTVPCAFEPFGGGTASGCYRPRADGKKKLLPSAAGNTRRPLGKEAKENLIGLLSRSDFLGETSINMLSTIAERFELHEFPAGTHLIEQGKENHAFFVVHEGTAVVSIQRGLFKRETEVARLTEGSLFGEMSMVLGEHASATVTASEGGLWVYAGSHALIEFLCERVPEFSGRLEQLVKSRQGRAEPLDNAEANQSGGGLRIGPDVRTILQKRGGVGRDLDDWEFRRFAKMARALKIFKNMDLSEIDLLLEQIEYWEFPQNSKIIKEGERGFGLLLIDKGSVEVKSGGGLFSSGDHVTSLGPGALVGERSIINFMPTSADVIAEKAMGCFVVSVALFKHLISENTAFNDTIHRIAKKRENH